MNSPALVLSRTSSKVVRCTSMLQHLFKNSTRQCSSKEPKVEGACKAASIAKKLRSKTPIGKLDELEEGRHPYQEKEPLQSWPDNTNPSTGEVGGPRGPEPTRYGDWERKGRVSDF